MNLLDAIRHLKDNPSHIMVENEGVTMYSSLKLEHTFDLDEPRRPAYTYNGGIQFGGPLFADEALSQKWEVK